MNALDNHQVRFNAKRKTFTFKLKYCEATIRYAISLKKKIAWTRKLNYYFVANISIHSRVSNQNCGRKIMVFVLFRENTKYFIN